MRPSVILALAALAGSGAAFAPHGGIFTRTVTRTAAEKKGGLTLPTFGKKAAPAKEPAKKKGIAGGIQFPTRAIPESDKAVLPVRQKVGGVVKGTVNKLPLLSGVRLEGLVGWNSRADFINRALVATLFTTSIIGLVAQPLLNGPPGTEKKEEKKVPAAKKEEKKADKKPAAKKEDPKAAAAAKANADAAAAKAAAEKKAKDDEAAAKKKAEEDKKKAEEAEVERKRKAVEDAATNERQIIINKGEYYKTRTTEDVVNESRSRREALIGGWKKPY